MVGVINFEWVLMKYIKVNIFIIIFIIVFKVFIIFEDILEFKKIVKIYFNY